MELWNLCATQWRISMAGRAGLDYTAVFKVAEALAIDITPGLIRKLQALEGAALENDMKGAKK